MKWKVFFFIMRHLVNTQKKKKKYKNSITELWKHWK